LLEILAQKNAEFFSERNVKNGYPDWFFNKAIRRFQEQCNNSSSNEKYEKDFLFTIGIPYFGKPSKLFAKRLCAFV